jgi:archaellin
MNKRDWTYVIIAMVVVAVVVSLVMSKIGGDASLSPAPRTGVTTYTKADVDTMLSQVYTKAEVQTQIVNTLKYNCTRLTFGTKSSSWSRRIELDTNRDTVVTGDELCKAIKPQVLCISTERISYNTFSSLRPNTITSVTSETIGCAGGESNNFYANNTDEGMVAWCCLI